MLWRSYLKTNKVASEVVATDVLVEALVEAVAVFCCPLAVAVFCCCPVARGVVPGGEFAGGSGERRTCRWSLAWLCKVEMAVCCFACCAVVLVCAWAQLVEKRIWDE